MRTSAVTLVLGALLALTEAHRPKSTVVQHARRTATAELAARTAAVHARQNNIEIHTAYAQIDNIEIHSAYAAPIGTDSGALVIEGSTTKWIGVNNEYLTQITSVTTVNNAETTVVVEPAIAVVTAVVAEEGIEVGDVTVLVSDKIQDELAALVNEGVAACKGVARKRATRKRSGSCLLDLLGNAASKDEVVAGLNAEEFQALVLTIAEHAPEALRLAYELAKSQAYKNRLALMFAAAVTAGAFGAGEIAANVGELTPHKFKFKGGSFGSPAKDEEQENKCDGNGQPDENSPFCDATDCQGDDKVCQAEGKNKNCPCGHFSDSFIDAFDAEALKKAQEVLTEADKESLEETTNCEIKLTAFPQDAFHSDKYNIAKNFCPRWEGAKDQSTFMIVNEAGDEMPRLRRRTPPVSMANLFDWRAELTFERSENGGDCVKSCDDAFQQLSSGCASSSPGRWMYETGELGIGCGKFTFKLVAPPKPQEPEQQTPPPPTFNEPPARTLCNSNGDCESYTCPDDGHKAHCQSGAAGDPFTSYCQC